MLYMNVEDNYHDYIKNNSDVKGIIYGAGNKARRILKYIGQADYIGIKGQAILSGLRVKKQSLRWMYKEKEW